MSVTLETYLRKRESLNRNQTQYRNYCQRCKKPTVTCYCSYLKPFASNPTFVILMHPREVKRSIATGRMAFLSLTNSYLFEGVDFTNHPGVNQILMDSENQCFVLWPGMDSLNLSKITLEKKKKIFSKDKRVVVFILDATWAQARRMKRLSLNLHPIPFLCFTPKTPSMFLVRQQPAEHCYSTIEAVHACIELLDLESAQPKQNLLETFAAMVNQQVEYEMIYGAEKQYRSTRGVRNPLPSIF